MTAERVEQLSRYLAAYDLVPPNDAFDIYSETGIRSAGVARFTQSYKSARFGFDALRSLASAALPFPAWFDGDDLILFRMYCFLRGAKPDLVTQQALAFVTPHMRQEKSVLEGMLLARDTDFQKIAGYFGMPEEAIRLYEKSFFNVRDRMKDLPYLASQVYPEGRQVEMIEDYMNSEETRMLIRRAGYNFGLDDVLHFAGFPAYAIQSSRKTGNLSAKDLEGVILAQGSFLARNGFINQRAVPAIRSAVGLIAASKMGGTEQGAGLDDDLPGVAGFLRGEMRRAAELRQLEAKTIDITESLPKKGLQGDPASDAAARAGVPVFKPKKKDA